MKIAYTAAAIGMVAVAGCGGTASGTASGTPPPSVSPVIVRLPVCSTGHGRGSTAALKISQHGSAFRGVYLVGATGMPAGTYLRYDVAGTARGGRLTSTWSAGAVALRITGHYSASAITLDDPRHQFSVVVFHAAPASACAGVG